MLCFKFIFIYQGKYVSADPDYTFYTVSSEDCATKRGINLQMSLFHIETSHLKLVLSVSFLNRKDYISKSARTVIFNPSLHNI